MTTEKDPLYSLISLEDFKVVTGVDDREDKIVRFCLVTSTLTIEQYCKRRLIRKKHFERIEFHHDLLLPLKEYPVSKILAVFAMNNEQRKSGINAENNGEVLEPEFYHTDPDYGLDLDIPFSLSLSPALFQYRRLTAVKVIYWAGYPFGKIPADLSAACMELAMWNLNRYRGRRVGLTGNIRGSGKEGEHFEMSMPENVKNLLEPYRRKLI